MRSIRNFVKKRRFRQIFSIIVLSNFLLIFFLVISPFVFAHD
jgi:hypothetical protein